MFQKLAEVEKRFEELNRLLSDPAVTGVPGEYQKYAREHSEIDPLVSAYRAWKKIASAMEESEKLLIEEKDPEFAALAREELTALKSRREESERTLKELLLPKDPRDAKNVIMEIRAGTGGEEAALFCSNLLRMYVRYADAKRWKTEILSSNETGKGGFKEVIVGIQGRGVYSRLKFESGVHRVQRVPETEAQGRIHTSAATVAILPEAEEIDIKINPADLKVDVYRSSGPGGQSVNTTDSAVRVTHIPTGLVVTCQDEKSQHKNRDKAMKVLRARLFEEEQRRQQESLARDRKQQVGSGDRSERIRTYNFPQERVTDHRIGLTLHKLSTIMEGELDEIIDALVLHHQTEALRRNENNLAEPAER